MTPQPLNYHDSGGEEAEKQAETEEVSEKEKETLEEAAASEKPAKESEETAPSEEGDDAAELARQVQGLSQEREKLLQEIQSLRGQRRELKQEELHKVETQIDELKDLNPEEVALIDRIFKAKGYASKEEVQKIYYNQVKQEQLNSFLEKYPEFKPENDPNDINWNALQRELSFYRAPEDPHGFTAILERARKAVQPANSGEQTITKTVQQRQLKTAGVGKGGVIRSSSSQTRLTEQQKDVLSRGGWTEEEIKKLESK